MHPHFELQNGATPMFFHGNIVLAIRDHKHHPFVVWTVFESGRCEWGHYVATLDEAITIFKKKTGLESIHINQVVAPANVAS